MKQEKDIITSIRTNKIVSIIRGAKPGTVPEVASALYEGGIRLLEVTLNTEGAIDAINQLTRNHLPGMLIGAGTVIDIEGAMQAIHAGASFIISPVVDREVIEYTRSKNVVSIPGAYTPTEILQGYKFGADIIKIFPSSSGIQYFKDLRAPLSQIPMMPTGGISRDNFEDFLRAGAVAVGIGSSLFDSKNTISDSYLVDLTRKAREFTQILEANN